jgi:hypothetical protein
MKVQMNHKRLRACFYARWTSSYETVQHHCTLLHLRQGHASFLRNAASANMNSNKFDSSIMEVSGFDQAGEGKVRCGGRRDDREVKDQEGRDALR